MTIETILAELHNAKNAKEKEELLEKAGKQNLTELFEGFYYAFNPYINLDIQKAPYIEDDDDAPDKLGWKKFKDILTKIEHNEIVEVQAILNDIVHKSSVFLWNNWYRRILLQNFKGTITPQLLNRVITKNKKLTQYRIPLVVFQKHHIYNNTYLVGKGYVDEFIKGDRQAIIIDSVNKKVLCFNDKGKSITPDERLAKFMHYLPSSIMFDSVKTEYRTHIVDILPLSHFVSGFSDKTQEERHNTLVELQGIFFQLFGKDFIIHPKVEVDLSNKEHFAKIQSDFRMQGVDTIMVKQLSAPYMCRKSTNWVKFPLT